MQYTTTFRRALLAMAATVAVANPTNFAVFAADSTDQAPPATPAAPAADPAANQPAPAATTPSADSTATTAPPPDSTDKGAIPSWLKEYAPKETGTTSGAEPSKPVLNAVAPKPVQQATPKKPATPVTLFGRIEELTGNNSATLPIKLNLKTQKPQLDPRGQALTAATSKQNLSGGLVSSFPTDWAGTYTGQLKIHAAIFDKIRWDFDAAEASKEQQLMRPGTMGDVSFYFTQDRARKVSLQPTQVIFTGTLGQSQTGQQMANMFSGQNQGNNPLGGMFNAGTMTAMMQSMPYQWAMHLGNLTQGRGLTGNQLNSQLMKNDIRQLAPNVLEQCVVTWDNDYNPTTRKMRSNYSESVLRFTKLNSSQLYVQAATVNYRQDGKFENKYLLYGTVNRAYAQSQPSYPSGFPQGFPLPGQSGGMGGLDQLIRQLQGR
jgi:hypothetical protein